MYIGILFQRLGGVSFYSPTFSRGGLAATFAIEVFALAGSSPTLECIVEHKNVEDTALATAGTFSSMTSTGVAKLDVSTLKEQIRLNITVGGASTSNAVYANVLAPMWWPY